MMKSEFDCTQSIYAQIPASFNLASYLLARNAHQPEKIAFINQHRDLTYGQLQQWVPHFAGFFHALGGRPEERVVILLPDSPEFVLAFLGAIWNGQVAVLINEAVTLDDIAYMIDNSRARVVVSTSEWLQKLTPCLLSRVEHWVTIENDFWDKGLNSPPRVVAATSKDEAAFWAYTSGSTGRPKGVQHAHYSAIVACVRYAVQTLALSEQDILYSAPPMAFSYGLGTSLYMPMFLGASALLAEAASAFGYIDIINRHRPTVFFGIPNHYALILALKDVMPLTPHDLRLCICAGEALPPSLWEAWLATYQLAICEGIGTTESTHIFISNRPGLSVPGSTGKPVPGYQIHLLNANGLPVEENEAGLLHVEGEGMMLGYWNRLPDTQTALQGRTLTTADLYRYDENGHYYFVGRQDELLKFHGMWIAPVNIENEIIKNNQIKESAIIVVPSKTLSNMSDLIGYLVKTEGVDDPLALISTLKCQLKRVFKKHQTPKHFYFIDQLPRTSTGKINRKQLQALYTTHKEEQ